MHAARRLGHVFESMIELQNITKSFAGQIVVDDVSLEVAAASTVVLIGPSGCGKSTLLRMIVGLITPDSGNMSVGDHALTPANRAAIRDNVGYVIQDGGLFPHLTAAENVCIRGQLAGWSKQKLRDRMLALAELTRFPLDGLDRYPAMLSGGQRQRVGMMRALLTDPAVLLLDEPLAALDPIIRRDLQDDLRNIFLTLKKTVVLVTHDLHEAAWFADTIVLLKAGRIQQIGSAAELVNEPAADFVTQFVQAQRTSDFGAALT